MYVLWFYFIKYAVTLLRTLAYVMQWSNQKGGNIFKTTFVSLNNDNFA